MKPINEIRALFNVIKTETRRWFNTGARIDEVGQEMLDHIEYLEQGGGNITLVTTNNNNFQVDFSGDLHYNTVPAGTIGNLGFTCVNCPTKNKEFVYIVTNNRTTLLQTALPASPIVQGGITYTFIRTTATTTVGISAGASCEFNFLFIKIDDTNFEVRVAVQKFVV